jgi:DNA-binding GntR family transcriptional regulator
MVQLINRTLEDKVLELLRQRILDAAPGFEPGARLFMRELADDLGVSITPVQHAIRSLRNQGLVDIRPRKGTFVARLELERVVEIWGAVLALQMGCLEVSAGAVLSHTLDRMRAAVQAAEGWVARGDWRGYLDSDVEFHRLLVSIAGNPLLVAAYDALVVRLYPLVSTYEYLLRGGGTQGVVGHRRIIDLLEVGDRRAIIRALLEDHQHSLRLAAASHIAAPAHDGSIAHLHDGHAPIDAAAPEPEPDDIRGGDVERTMPPDNRPTPGQHVRALG